LSNNLSVPNSAVVISGDGLATNCEGIVTFLASVPQLNSTLFFHYEDTTGLRVDTGELLQRLRLFSLPMIRQKWQRWDRVDAMLTCWAIINKVKEV
jgi:hypothetical protein